MSLLNIFLIFFAAVANAMVSFFLKKAALSSNIFYNLNFLFAMCMGTIAIICIVFVYQSKINMGQAVLYLTLTTLLIAVVIDYLVLKNALKWMDVFLLTVICGWIAAKVFSSYRVVS